MTVIIRRERQHAHSPRMALGVAAALVLAGLGGVVALAWQRGGPRPVHEISYGVPQQGQVKG